MMTANTLSSKQVKNKQRATITPIEDHNKSFEIKIADYPIALEANGNVLLPLSKGTFGAEVEFKNHGKHDF